MLNSSLIPSHLPLRREEAVSTKQEAEGEGGRGIHEAPHHRYISLFGKGRVTGTLSIHFILLFLYFLLFNSPLFSGPGGGDAPVFVVGKKALGLLHR